MNKKAIVIFLLCIALALCGSGCIRDEQYPDCFVNSLADAEIKMNELVCSKGDVIYYYDSNGIYQFNDGTSELLIKTDDVITGIVCVSHGLYYSQIDADSDTLYRYNLENGTVSAVHKSYGISKVFCHGEDVFVCGWDDSESGMIWVFRDGKKYCIYDLIRDCEEESYTWGEYVIHVIDNIIQGNIGAIYANDGWKYFQGYPAYIEAANVQVGISGDTITFDGVEKDYSMVFRKLRGNGASSIEFASIYDDRIFILYQCGNVGYINQPSHMRLRDVICSIDMKTQEMTLVYDTGGIDAQIGGFSVERDEMYLVKQDGVYRCDMQGNHETKIIDGFYDRLVFESCNDYLFIYDASNLWEWKLLLME